MKIKPDFLLRKVAGQNVVVPIGDAVFNLNAAISLNETAAFLWQLLTDGCDKDSLIARLTGEYNVDETTAAHDVDAFLQVLKEHDILAEENETNRD